MIRVDLVSAMLRGLTDESPGETGTAPVARSAPGAATQTLEMRAERTLLVCEAMWTILRDKLGVTDLELLQRINDLDLSDGQLDGKVRKSAVACPKCGRTIARRLPKCMYCGQAIMHDPFV